MIRFLILVLRTTTVHNLHMISIVKKTYTGKSYALYDVGAHDNPDDFADEWAEEFGDGNYDDVYDYWEDEME